MNTCQAMTKDGIPCTAPAQTGKEYCFTHDPEQEHARTEARAKGGQTRAEQLNGAIVHKLATATELRDYLSTVMRNVETGLIDPKRGTAISNLCRVQLEVIERAKQEAEETKWAFLK